MISGTMQDFITAKERMPESLKEKLWRKFVRMFDLQKETMRWQIFYAWLLGCSVLTAFWLTKLIEIGKAFH